MIPLAAVATFVHQSSNLLSWSTYDSSIKADLTSNAVLTENGWWFIDPIQPPDGFQAALKGRPVLGILLTNENHERDARLLAREFGAKVYAHEDAKPHLPNPPNVTFKGKELIEQGPIPYFIPGSSYGETAYFFKNQKILALGDALINLSQTGFSFLPDKYCQNRTLAKQNVKPLSDLDFETITFAHGAPIESAKPSFLKLMKSFTIKFFLLLIMPFLLVSCETTGGSGLGKDARSGYIRPPASEFRGAWVYDPRQFDPDDVVRDLKESGFNNVFVRLSSAGAAYYPSSVLPRAPGTARDFAQEYVDAGKKYGVRVHAWHVCFMMHHAPSGAINEAIKKGEVMRDGKNRVLRPTYNAPVRTPALAKNRMLEKQAMLELVTKYDLDGVQFDYIRYFSPNVDYSTTARLAFEKTIGLKMKKWPSDVATGKYRDQYKEWKTELVTTLVQETSQAVRVAKPGVKVSAAVWHDPEVGLRDYSQDWVRWVRKGYLDFVVPMNYTVNNDYLSEWVAHQQSLVGNKIPLYAGLGSYMLRSADHFNRQIDICRRSGLQGYVMYSYDEQIRRNFLRYVSN